MFKFYNLPATVIVNVSKHLQSVAGGVKFCLDFFPWFWSNFGKTSTVRMSVEANGIVKIAPLEDCY